MAKDPAILFYYQDFLVGTEFMDDAEVGIYIRLLCHLYDKNELSEKQVLRICSASAFENIPDDVKNKLKKDNNGMYFNQRARDEKEKRLLFTESRRQNALGIKSKKAYAEHMEDINKDINKDTDKDKELYSETILQIVRDFYSTKIKINKMVNPKWETNHKFYADSCDVIDKLHRIDKIPFDVIRMVIMRSIKDEFWQNQIISLAGLRVISKNKQSKFMNAYASLATDYKPSASKRELLGYRYECPSCENITVEREFKRVEEFDAYTCKVEGCSKVQLQNKEMVGSTLLYIEKVYKEES